MEKELDELNDETFGQAELGDWEFEHDTFVSQFDNDDIPPNACELPRFWERENISEFWVKETVNVSQSFENLNLVEDIEKLVCDDEFEDPAILDISKKPSKAANISAKYTKLPLNNLSTTSIWEQNNGDNFKFISQQSKNNELEISSAFGLNETNRMHPQSNIGHFEAKITPNWSYFTTPSTIPTKTSQPLECNQKSTPSRFDIHPNFSTHSFMKPPPPPNTVNRMSVQNILVSLNMQSQQHIAPPILLPLNQIGMRMMTMVPPPQLSAPNNLLFHNSFITPRVHYSDGVNYMKMNKSQDLHGTENEGEKVDLTVGSWMNQHEKMLVLNFQSRCLTVTNPYVEDYYFALKWLRWMSKNRERKIRSGIPSASLPLPYFYMKSPINSAQLISSDNHHRISLNCRFVIQMLNKHLPSNSMYSENIENHRLLETPKQTEAKRNHSHSTSSNNSELSFLHSTQLGRPTKSNINAQRIIADLSVANALADDEFSYTETESKTDEVENTRSLFQNYDNSSIIKQRRRLTILARIERLYAVILNIDETNMSLARIVITKNDESRNLLIHRNILFKQLYKDLFRIKNPDLHLDKQELLLETTPIQRTLVLDIFEVFKGIRLFSTLLRFLPNDDCQFCVAEFISNFSRIRLLCSSHLDILAAELYTPIRNSIYLRSERKSIIFSCLPFLTSPVDSNTPPSSYSDKNVLDMFTSKLGVSILFCLLDACARNSRPDNPSIFCSLFVYACRILEHVSLDKLATPLEYFYHFSKLNPQFLMPHKLDYVENLHSLGNKLLSLAVGQLVQEVPHPSSSSSSKSGSSSTPSLTPVAPLMSIPTILPNSFPPQSPLISNCADAGNLKVNC